jgi:hypothetical protein
LPLEEIKNAKKSHPPEIKILRGYLNWYKIRNFAMDIPLLKNFAMDIPLLK